MALKLAVTDSTLRLIIADLSTTIGGIGTLRLIIAD
jgi:hypothetical protein